MKGEKPTQEAEDKKKERINTKRFIMKGGGERGTANQYALLTLLKATLRMKANSIERRTGPVS